MVMLLSCQSRYGEFFLLLETVPLISTKSTSGHDSNRQNVYHFPFAHNMKVAIRLASSHRICGCHHFAVDIIVLFVFTDCYLECHWHRRLFFHHRCNWGYQMHLKVIIREPKKVTNRFTTNSPNLSICMRPLNSWVAQWIHLRPIRVNRQNG